MTEEQAKTQYGILSGKVDTLCLLPLSLNIPFVFFLSMHLCGGRCGRAKREVVDSLLLSGLWQLVSAGTINTAHSGDPQCPDHIRSTWGCLFKMLNPRHHPAAAKLLQSCPTLCNPTDGSPPGSPVPGVLQARTLEWVAISFSNA